MQQRKEESDETKKKNLKRAGERAKVLVEPLVGWLGIRLRQPYEDGCANTVDAARRKPGYDNGYLIHGVLKVHKSTVYLYAT
jgi:hypothetical protein